MSKRFVCTVCGYVHDGDEPPESCPVCGVGPELFTEEADPQATEKRPAGPQPRRFVCTVCGYVHEGDEPPESCPVCGVGPEFFTEEADPQTTERRPAGPQPRRFICSVCGYIHEGDEPPESCPVCCVGPELFTEEAAPAQPELRRFVCSVCGYIHEGDEPPESCPICCVGPELFTEEAPSVPAAGPRLVIIGGGAAAYAALKSARLTDPTARLTLIHREPSLPYDRMSLTRYLAGDVTRAALPLVDSAWLNAQGVLALAGEVRAIDLDAHTLTLADGQTLPYDRLLLATGAHAFVPPLPGVRRDGVFPLRTLADADAALARVHPGIRAVVIGGGLLGLEIAGALARRGVAVTVLEGAPWLLPRQLAKPAADRLAARLADSGVQVRCGVQVAELEGDESLQAVRLADGERLPAELCLIAVGVRPNTGLPKAAGLVVERGLKVDDQLRTSHPDVFAAGDLAEHAGQVGGLWSTALAQGEVAGKNLAGAAERYTLKAVSSVLKVLDFPVVSAGRLVPAEGERAVTQDTPKRCLWLLLDADGRINGMNLVGEASPALLAALTRAVALGLRPSELPELATLTL